MQTGDILHECKILLSWEKKETYFKMLSAENFIQLAKP